MKPDFRRIFKILIGVVLITTPFYFIQNHRSNTAKEHESVERQFQSAQKNKHLIDSVIKILHTGNVLLRSGIGPDSYMMAHMNQKDKTYSHCGLVLIEGGYPFIYHCLGGEDNPDDRLRRDSIQTFLDPGHNSGMAVVEYDIDSTHLQNLTGIIKGYYRAHPKFDLKFDLSTSDRLYCSEFVYKALDSAMADSTYILPTHAIGITFVAIDNLYLNKHARVVCQLKFE